MPGTNRWLLSAITAFKKNVFNFCCSFVWRDIFVAAISYRWFCLITQVHSYLEKSLFLVMRCSIRNTHHYVQTRISQALSQYKTSLLAVPSSIFRDSQHSFEGIERDGIRTSGKAHANTLTRITDSGNPSSYCVGRRCLSRTRGERQNTFQNYVSFAKGTSNAQSVPKPRLATNQNSVFSSVGGNNNDTFGIPSRLITLPFFWI